MPIILAPGRQRQIELCKLRSAWSTLTVPGQPGIKLGSPDLGGKQLSYTDSLFFKSIHLLYIY